MPSATFKVKIAEGEEVLAYPAGKMRMYFIKILPGDRVLMELSPDKKEEELSEDCNMKVRASVKKFVKVVKPSEDKGGFM